MPITNRDVLNAFMNFDLSKIYEKKQMVASTPGFAIFADSVSYIVLIVTIVLAKKSMEI